MDVVDLKLVVHILDTSSVSLGGERVFLSSPAASNRFKHVEEMMEVKLFYRGHQGVTPTPAGMCFAKHARQALLHMKNLRTELQAHAQGTKGHLRMAANTSFVTDYMPEVLQDFLLAHPDVSIDLQPRRSIDIVRGVQDGSVDIGLISATEPCTDLGSIHLGADPLVAAVGLHHMHADRTSMTIEELLGQPHISLSGNSTMTAFIQEQLKRSGHRLLTRVSVPDYHVMCQMASAGLGIGVLHRSIARRHNALTELALLPIEEDWAAQHRYLLLRDLEALPGYAREHVTAIADRSLAHGIDTEDVRRLEVGA